MHHKRKGSRRRRTALIGAAAVVAAATIGGTFAVASESDSSDASPSQQAEPPADWRPWLTSFHGGDQDDGPSTDANECTTNLVSRSPREPGTDEDDAKATTVRCWGTGFSDERLSLVDGTHDPDAPKPEPGDVARVGDVVLNTAAREMEGDSDVPLARVRGLAADTREVKWEHDVREHSVYVDDVVVGDEATEITNLPEDGDYEDWTPSYEPGGDIIAWDPVSGEEKWRVTDTPKDQWCSPAKVENQLFVSCQAEEVGADKATWYRVNEETEQLEEFYQHVSAGGQFANPLGVVNDQLVFLRTDKAGLSAPEELVLVDPASGEKQVKQLPEIVASTGLLRGDDLFFWTKQDGALLAVDAATGEQRWLEDVNFDYPSAPAVSEERGEVYVADPAGRLVALDRETGEEKWRTEEARAEDGGTNPGEMEPESSVRVVRGLLLVSTGNTVYTVSPDAPEAEPEDVHKVELTS